MNILIAAASTYGLLLLLIFLFQARLIYFPNVGRELAATPRDAGLDYEDVQLRSADNVVLNGWWVPTRDARGAVLILHGNAGNISHRIGYLTLFNRLHYATLLIDYRGYGKSGGSPSEEGTYRDAEAAWLHLVETRKVNARDIVIVGESLGGAVATWLAAKYAPRALIIASAFTSVPDLGAQIYPWLPVRLLARIRYDNLDRIAKIAAPVLVAHSRDDEIVPFAHGEALFAAAREPKQFLAMRGGHNDALLFARDEWAAAVAAFLAQVHPKD
ncbi:MAG TPA: alpha/beta hydrolase [Burkholderiales bacterium]|nr:alpha/beta hydrolase [Burkholderiales bacterium]